jgi:hypothetical protein
MPPGRNDPCPCGSGRKYKRCCWAKDRASSTLRLAPEEGASAGPMGAAVVPPPDVAWEVDLVPLPVSFDSDADARPVALLVVSDGFVLHHDILARPPAEAAAVADLLAEAIRAVAERVGAPPPRVLVRVPAVAVALRAASLPGEPQVAAAPLRELDLAASSLISHLAGGKDDRPPSLSRTETWKGWGLGGALVADLFRAAAVFHRAKPWRLLENEDVLRYESPSGSTWTVCVMGAGGEQFGIVLYEDARDFRRLIQATHASKGFRAMRSAVISLTFDRRGDLPPRMRKEILAAGWEVAAPDAYPSLLALNTPGGGVTAAQGADLIAALRGVSGFVDHFRAELQGRSGRQLRWRDPDTGADLTLPRNAARADLPPRPEALAAALPAGPGAAPEAAIEAHDTDDLERRSTSVLEAFEAALAESGLAARTVQRHTANAGLLLGYLADYESIPLNAMTEYDLRVFLHDWCLRKVMASETEMLGVPVSLRRFFAFVAERERVVFPWAAEILADRAKYEARLATVPGQFFFDPSVREWQTEVTLDLSDRELLPDGHMADGGEWGDTMGSVEWALHRELQRRWLVWRDEVIATGVVEPSDVRKELLKRQRSWESRPHKGSGGATPVAAIRREREGSR